MKKIILSIVATTLAFSSQAQVSVTQGTLGDNNQKSNSITVNQKSDIINYHIQVYSPNSTATVNQAYDASAAGNWVGAVQNGSVNGATITQAGLNNNIYFNQLNSVTGEVAGNGNQASISQLGKSNEQRITQITSVSAGGFGGSIISTSQAGELNKVFAVQIGHGVGHSASVTQGEESLESEITFEQAGSNNNLTIDQVSGTSNRVNVSQNNASSDNAGNTLTVTQSGDGENSAVFGQNGSNNVAAITQNGSKNEISYLSRQTGSNNTASLTQDGVGRFMLIIQEGNLNSITAIQSHSTSTGLVIESTQRGNGNSAIINQGAAF